MRCAQCWMFGFNRRGVISSAKKTRESGQSKERKQNVGGASSTGKVDNLWKLPQEPLSRHYESSFPCQAGYKAIRVTRDTISVLQGNLRDNYSVRRSGAPRG